jgi:signal transduction histidine kinase
MAMIIFGSHLNNCMKAPYTGICKNNLLTKLTLFVLLLSISVSIFGQSLEDPVVVIGKNFKSTPIRKSVNTVIPKNFNIPTDYSENIFTGKKLYKTGVIPPGQVSKKMITRFMVINDTDEADSICFFPGFSYWHTILYKIENDKATALPVVAPNFKDSISFRLFHLAPHDTLRILAECYPVKTYTNTFRPNLINSTYIGTFAIELVQNKKNVTLFTYIFCGLLLMMVLFSLANFFQGSNREFLYYAGYAFSLGVMLFTKQFYYNRSYHRTFFFESYLDFIFQALGIWFFVLFMIRFLETRRNFPFLHKVYLGGVIFLPIVMIVYSYMHFSNIDYYWENLLENFVTKILLLAMIVTFLLYAAWSWHHKLLRYLFWGNLLFLLFSLFSLLMVLNRNAIQLPGILNDSLVLYELGLLIELIFFLMGLTYKNRTQLIEQTKERERLKMENQRKELEKQMAVMQAHQEERERISADIHDELGSGMTTIRLMSEIAKNKLKENVPVEIEKISNSANEVLNKMNAIIWSMNSSNDTVDSLVSYIRVYAIEYFDGTSVDCKVVMPENIPLHDLSGDKRRNIFLCVKETLNNILKHSKATLIMIDIEVDSKLRIKITDNGVGIDPDNIRKFGNGLKNIERRMKTIGGEYSISNVGGTQTRLELPL